MMGKGVAMRRMAVMVLATTWPGLALAQEAVIRLEAKRQPAAATEAAAGWAARFDDVVTLPLPDGWTGIALGPLDAAEAEARLRDLRAAGAVPGDAFVTIPAAGTALTPAGGGAPIEGGSEAVAEAEAPPPPGSFLHLESFADRAEAEAALARTREEFPEAGLWDLPEGRFAVALGPVAEEAARAWLPVLAEAGLIPEDARQIDGADLGQPLDEGQAPDLPLPDAPLALPPLDEMQRVLRWAGHYSGEIDGKDGPMTRAAIRAQIAEGRASTDPGTALQRLIAARADWRDRTGIAPLRDDATGLTVAAPMNALQFDRAERALSIYGPRDGSGAALILFSQPGGQQDLLDLAGLVTALGWVPAPERRVRQGHVTLKGANDAHIGAAEGWVRDGRAEGWVLIWPAADPETQARLNAEMSDSLRRHAPGATETPATAAPRAGSPGADASSPETATAPEAPAPVLP